MMLSNSWFSQLIFVGANQWDGLQVIEILQVINFEEQESNICFSQFFKIFDKNCLWKIVLLFRNKCGQYFRKNIE